MSTVSAQPKDYAAVVRERHSVRHYDPTFVIPEAELKDLLAEATLAPSSGNSQLWRFLIVSDDETKKKLHPIANSQQQVLEASATIVVLGDLEGYKKIGRINQLAVEAGYMEQALADQFTERYVKAITSMPPEKIHSIVDTDGGLVSMQLMLSAKARGYDTVPMGGFNHEKLVEAFAIPSHLRPILLIALGKAATPGRLTARLPVDEVVFWNKIEK